MPKKRPPKRKPPRKPQRFNAPESMREVSLTAELGPDNWEHLTAAAGDDGTPAPLPRFSMIAYGGGIMRPNTSFPGYGRGIVLNLAGFTAGNQTPVDYFHNNSDPIGHTESVEIGANIKAAGVLSVPGPSRDRVVEGAKNGFRWKPSVDVVGDLSAVERVLPGQTVTVNGRRLRGPFLIFQRGHVRAITFCTVPGDSTASANVRATLTEEPDMNFSAWLKSCGINEADQTDEQIATLRATFDAAQAAADPEPAGDDEPGATDPPADPAGVTATNPRQPAAPAPILDRDEREAQRVERLERIATVCASAGHPMIDVNGVQVSLHAHAIRNGWTPDATELHILRASAPHSPAIHSRDSSDTVNVQAYQGAVLLAAGIALDSPAFNAPGAAQIGVPAFLRASLNNDARDKAMNAAHELGAVNMLEMARDAIYMDGGTPPRNREALIQAAASSGSLSEIYSHTVGAALLVGYREATRTLDRWTGQDEVQDFRQFERHTAEGEETLGYVPPGGEADHATAGATFEYIAVDMYGKQYEITRHDYINNNLGLLARKPMAMGRAAYKTEENLGYSTLASNPTMRSTGRALFHATDGTLATSKPLTRANASLMIANLGKLTHGDESMDLEPGWAVVPTELGDTAVQVYNSPVLSNDSGSGSVNTVARHGVQVVPVSRLSNGVRHPKTKTFYAGSAVDHYLFAKGIEGPVRVYLAGSGRVPMVRVSQLTQGKWGTHIDVSHDVGFAFEAAKCGVKFEG